MTALVERDRVKSTRKSRHVRYPPITRKFVILPKCRVRPGRELSGCSKIGLDGAVVSGRSLNPCVDSVAERQEIDRFGRQIVGAALQCLALRLRIAIGRNHDHGDVRSQRFRAR